MTRFDPSAVLEGLKDFQRHSVEYAFERLYGADDPVDRFLVADEVGLGKTLVARGLIAKAIEHLQDKRQRVNVVYICSNAEIARQNISRLNVTGAKDFSLATRITLLPVHLRSLHPRLNFVSFTPGTSFHMGSSEGVWPERVLLYWLMHAAWGPGIVQGPGAVRLFQGGVREFADFSQRVRDFDRGDIDEGIGERFAGRLREDERLRRRFEELRELYRDPRERSEGEKALLKEFVGELRHLLATVCVEHLEPDLVILDEFQRFKRILHGNDPAAEIAQSLFDYADAKVLLLSATPYKMYTLHEEAAADDHYRDLEDTLRFLAGSETDRILDEFRAYRADLLAGRGSLAERRDRLQGSLLRFMIRNERLAVRSDRDGMLAERPAPGVRLEAAEVAGFVELSSLVSSLGSYDAIELWKSAPYLLSFMEGYQLKRRVEDAVSAGDPLVSSPVEQLTWTDVSGYERVDPANARLRSLYADVLDTGAWRLLWLPPALPYHSPRAPFDDPELGSFTKRLIFSAWTVVPKAVASLLSYEAERRVFEARDRFRSYEDRTTMARLLEPTREGERLRGMPVFGLLYPSPALAELGDPLEFAGEELVPVEEVLRDVRGRVEERLSPLVRDAPQEGREDEAWYWAAPLLLDQGSGGERNETWWDRRRLADVWTLGDGEGGMTLWAEHVAHAREAVLGDLRLGRPPGDLAEVVTELALGSPGVVALRALSRVADGSLWEVPVRDAAASVAWGIRHLFNLPEAIEIVRGTGRHWGDDPYWRQVVEYSISGNLQAVLDEYVHVLPEWAGVADRGRDEIVREVASTIRTALALRTPTYAVDEIATDDGELRLQRHRMRGHFAMRFGDAGTEEGQTTREHLRVAFNSPFWPFVLASTSVGQEGLDFHLYCHAVVHWNLPPNPVDLEQREGRVHRYKGHAIRKNVASRCRPAAFDGTADPWETLFEAACAERPDGESELVPYWVFTGDAKIERYVPLLPLSKDEARYEALKRTVGAYRLAFGQPRQEDLVAYLSRSGADIAALDDYRIDLSPPRSR